MTYYNPNHGGDLTNPNHPGFVGTQELPSDAVVAAYNLAAALIDQIIIEHRCKTERSFKSALKAFDACNLLSPELEASDFESAKDDGCHANKPDDELDAALTLHDLITDIYVRDDCEVFNASLKFFGAYIDRLRARLAPTPTPSSAHNSGGLIACLHAQTIPQNLKGRPSC